MNVRDESSYRLRLCQGFLKEAEEDFSLERWRSCVANCQLSIENAGKAILALLGATPKTHDPAQQLTHLLKERQLSDRTRSLIRDLLPRLASLGPKEHFLTDYGDEVEYVSPWELFSRDSAIAALESARYCGTKSSEIVQRWWE